jgi:EAL and modified HD-GYP domain-containing signal transduction protein
MPPESAAWQSRFLIRQPLLDVRYQVVGYELSLRDRVPVEVLPGATDPAQVRDEYLIASVVDLDYQNALGDRLTLLDLDPRTLDNPMLGLLPRGKVALALASSTPDLAARVEALAGLGLQPVLDDDGDALAPVLPAACGQVRLDCGRLDGPTLGERAEYYRRLGAGHLIGRNIDSDEALEVCRRLAFDRFQGGFLGLRQGRGGRRLDGGVMQVMELLNLAREQATVERMEAVFKRNAALTYRLLRYINSPANGLRQPVQSIAQALLWLGHEPLYRWLSLLLFSAGSGDGRDQALLANALVRARFMENLGSPRLPPEQRGGLFIVGILSHLDALLDLPMAEALQPLSLPEAMRGALLGGDGVYAPYLRLAMACERFDQDGVAGLADAHAFSADEVNVAHVNALIWSETLEK